MTSARHTSTSITDSSGDWRPCKEGDAREALTQFEQAMNFGWGIREAPNNIGSALAEHGLLEEATEYFRMSADVDPRYLVPRLEPLSHGSVYRELARREGIPAGDHRS